MKRIWHVLRRGKWSRQDSGQRVCNSRDKTPWAHWRKTAHACQARDGEKEREREGKGIPWWSWLLHLLPFVLNPPCQFYELLGTLINLICICHSVASTPDTCKQKYEAGLNTPAALSHRRRASTAGHGCIHSSSCTGEGLCCCRQF